MIRTGFIIGLFLISIFSKAQVPTNISSTNPLAEQIMKGNYNPVTYLPTAIINHPDSIVRGLNLRISPDTMKKNLIELQAFYNRNSGSDTLSATRGIGAARKWAYSKFQQYSSVNQSRLIPSYLKFDQSICSMGTHKDIFAVLPGADTSDKRIIIVEGHIDTRCDSGCDTACLAQGMEDNASVTALVMELARVMSKYTFNHTIVFVLTTAEEQGLYGAEAFAIYVQQKGIEVMAVQNNDVIGGIICGQTSSPPSCPGLNDIDSTHVRIFSNGGANSAHKGLARYAKLEYKEELKPLVSVPMDIWIMSLEDRSGRGGDHIPFRLKGYTAVRFTSANEHGNGQNGTGYIDRQHSTSDILGVDTDNDQVIDSFYVNFNYLARNAAINGTSIGMMAISPKKPSFVLTDGGLVRIAINITQQTQYLHYRVGVRTTTNDWDSVYTIFGKTIDTIAIPAPGPVYVSVASVDALGVESLFSTEHALAISGVGEIPEENKDIMLLQNHPNPFDESTFIGVWVEKPSDYKTASIKIYDVVGKLVNQIPITLNKGLNEVHYDHGYHMVGNYLYSLEIDGKQIESKYMVFAN